MSLAAARAFSNVRAAPRFSRSLTVKAMADKVPMIRETISSNKVVVFSKTYCPYCTRVKDLFKQLKVDAKVLELDQIGEGDAIQQSLMSVTSKRTVPQVFINGNFIGGCDDTMAVHGQGKLIPLLEEAGVVA